MSKTLVAYFSASGTTAKAARNLADVTDADLYEIKPAEAYTQADTIFLGFPIWWYVAPKIINTFLESYDFTGKTIILFATSGGSGFGKTVQELASSCPGVAIREGRLFNANLSRDAPKKWVEEL